MGRNYRAIRWIFFAAAKGVVSYAAPKFLISLGVPLDLWIVAAAGWAGGALSLETAFWAAVVAIAVVLLSTDLWLPHLRGRLPLRSKGAERRPTGVIPLDEAARWMFTHSPALRRHSKDLGVIPGLYQSIHEYARMVIEYAGSMEVCTIYARPEEGLPLLRVEPEALKIANHSTLLGARVAPLIDGQIGRNDLKRVRDWIEADPNRL